MDNYLQVEVVMVTLAAQLERLKYIDVWFRVLNKVGDSTLYIQTNARRSNVLFRQDKNSLFRGKSIKILFDDKRA